MSNHENQIETPAPGPQGRINVNIPKDLHTALRVHAIKSDKTMAEALTDLLRVALKSEIPV